MEKNQIIENVTVILSEEAVFYGILGKILYPSPDKSLLEKIITQQLFEDVPFTSDQEKFKTGMMHIKEWINKCKGKNIDEIYESVLLDYTHLFVGGKTVPVPIWESVYFNKERMVFQEETIQVRKWYRKYKLHVEHLYHEPDDHIGIELSFVSYLAKLGLDKIEQDDFDGLKEILFDKKSFIEEHPFLWTPAWCDLIQKHGKTDFYKGIAYLVTGALETTMMLKPPQIV